MSLRLASGLSKFTPHYHTKIKAMVSLYKSYFFLLACPLVFSEFMQPCLNKSVIGPITKSSPETITVAQLKFTLENIYQNRFIPMEWFQYYELTFNKNSNPSESHILTCYLFYFQRKSQLFTGSNTDIISSVEIYKL